MGSVSEMATAVTASMGRMSSGVRESAAESESSLRELARSFGEVAESAELSARGTVSALGPVGGLIGAGFLVHYTEQLKESELQMKRLSDITGISVSQIAQFRLAMEELGVPTENLSRVLLHVTETMKEAAEGSKTDVIAFNQLGISTDNWSKGLPNVMDTLLKISDHLHDYKGNADDAAATTQILGLRMGLELAGGMAVGSKAIRERMDANKALGDETEKNVTDAQKLQEAEAELSARIQEALLPLLGVFANVLDGLMVFWAAIKADWTELVAIITMGAADVIGAIVTMGHAIKDALTFNWAGLKGDWDNYLGYVKNNYESLKRMIQEDNKDIQDALKLFKPVEGAGDRGNKGLPSAVSGSEKGPSRVQEWKQELEMMKADADTFHAVTAADEVNYWQRILSTQKLSAKERFQVEEELMRARHALAVDTYHQLISLDEEFIAATRAGSAERMSAVIKERDDVTRAWGAGSAQAIAASKKVLDEQIKVDQLAAQSVEQSVEKQTAAYQTGSAQRSALLLQGIEHLKTMRENVLTGKTATGAAEETGPVGPTPETDSKLRVLARQNEADEITKIIENLTARLDAEYKTQTAHAIQATLESERARVAAIATTGRALNENQKIAESSSAEIVAIARRQAAEISVTSRTETASQLRGLSLLESEGLISSDKRIELSRRVLAQDEASTTAEVQNRIDLIKAEEQSTIAIIEQEALKRAAVVGTIEAEREANDATLKAKQEADSRIEALEKQLTVFYQTMAQQRRQLSEEAGRDEARQAQSVADGIVGAFQKSFAQMQEGARFHVSLMSSLFRNLEISFAQMVDKMLASWAKMLAQKLILQLAHNAQIKTVETAEVAAHAGQEQAKVLATTAAQAEETTATAAGAESRTGLGLGEAIKSIMSDAAQAAAHAFKWVMKEVPFPANVALAPAAAAAAFAGVAVYSTLASAAGGMEVDRDQMAFLHKDEKVLPADLSRGFTSIIRAGTFAAPSFLSRTLPAAAASGGSAGPATQHSHYQNNEFNLYHHGDDARKVLESELVPRIQEAMRNGELKTI